MRTRPDVTFEITPDARPGEPVLVDLAVRCRAPTPIEGIALHLAGEEEVRLEGQRAERRRFLSLVARPAGEETLPAGERRYRVSFPLPEDTPCTYHGVRALIHYALRVKIPVAHWLDVDEVCPVLVAPRPRRRPAPAPLATTTERGEAPFLEVALDDAVAEPGEEIAGAVAAGNLRGRAIRGVELSLVGYERIRGAADRAIEAHRFTAGLPAGGWDEGREVPFRFQVPPSAAPSFDAGGIALFWCFEVLADMARGPAVVHTTPVTLACFDRPRLLGVRRRAGRRAVGTGRWRAVWEAAGALHGLALEPRALRLTGVLSGCEAAAWIDEDGAMAGELRWGGWGLDLEIAPRRVRPGGAPSGDALFDHFYEVRGRDPGQVRVVLSEGLRRALLEFDDAWLDDARAKVASRVSGHDQPWVGEFLGDLSALAAEIAEASARLRLGAGPYR